MKIVMNMDSSDTLTVKILGTKENDYTIEPRVEQIDEMSNVTYRDYKDASGNVVKSESVCASKYKPLNSDHDAKKMLPVKNRRDREEKSVPPVFFSYRWER